MMATLGSGDDACFLLDVDDAGAYGFAPRGWAIRHGRRKRLARLAWGKGASTEAFTLRESYEKEAGRQRGRSVFKRSANSSSERRYRGKYAHDLPMQRRRVQLRQGALADLRESLRNVSSSAELVRDAWLDVLDDSQGLPWEHELDCFDSPSPTDYTENIEELWICSAQSDETCSTCPSTTMSLDDAHEAYTKKLEVQWSDCLTPWEMAVLRAEKAADLFFSLHRERPQQRPCKGRSCQRVDESCTYRSLLSELKQDFQAVVAYHSNLATGPDSFERFRWRFLQQHGSAICRSLQSCFENGFHIKATPLSVGVGKSFQKACEGELQGDLCPAWHGTDEKNLDSIYTQGLVVPGRGNSVRVANGSAYGLGIYTAKSFNPSLSLSYARGRTRRLLVCGVLDNKNSTDVKDTGSALVVFDPRRVAPLFEATADMRAPPPLPRPPQSQPAAVGMSQPQGKTRKRKPRAVIHLTGLAAFLARRAAARRRGCSRGGAAAAAAKEWRAHPVGR